MTPGEFATRWRGVETSERASAQSHFLDLCAMLGEPGPTEADPTGTSYAFEKALEKTVGGGGFADVWKRDFFGWEYKAKRKDLKAACVQLLEYREASETRRCSSSPTSTRSRSGQTSPVSARSSTRSRSTIWPPMTPLRHWPSSGPSSRRPRNSGPAPSLRRSLRLVREGYSARMERDRRLRPDACRAWGMDLDAMKLSNGQPLWETLRALIEVRNKNVNRAEPVLREQAAGAIDCAEGRIDQMVRPLSTRLELEWPPVGWTHKGRTYDPVDASFDYMGS